LVGTIETLQKERDDHATEKSGQNKRMQEMMMEVKAMIEKSTEAERLMTEKRLKEERAKADERLAGELAKADEKLARELTKANKRIDEVEKRSSDDMAALQEQLRIAQFTTDQLQSELQSSNDRADEMFYKLQEVDAVTMDTLEWISLGVRPGSNQHLPELTRMVTGHSLAGSNQIAKPAQYRAGKTCFIYPTYRHAHRCLTHLARSTGIHPRFRY
jgi:uncharacterized membrane protein YccC